MRNAQTTGNNEPADGAFEDEEERIRSVYARRDISGKGSLYAWWRPDVLLNVYRFRATAAACIRRAGWEDLSNVQVLDVGCGSGGWLRQLCAWGACDSNLHGIDLLPDRITQARELNPNMDFRVASGLQLPFESGSMDLVTAHTVFSSVPNAAARERLAAEMMRMLKRRGRILIFDFRISRPGDRDTLGIRRREICRLFPDFQVASRSLDLAPPLLRNIAPASPVLALSLEALFPFLRTHSMYLLQPLGTKLTAVSLTGTENP